MIKFISSLCLWVFVFAASENLEDYRINLAYSACTPRNCTSNGPLCETCTSLVGCLEQPDGSFDKTPLATCTDPSFCVDGACTSDYDPFCWGTSDVQFPCQKVGIFPDPFYHTRFVLCVEDTELRSYLNVCESGFGFNIENDLCSIPVESREGECPKEKYPVPLCLTAGQSEALPEKPAMYYICEQVTTNIGKSVLYPYLDKCPGDTLYENYNCVEPNSSTNTPTTTSTPPNF